MSILLEAEHLTKIFTQRGKNPFKAVNDVSFTLKKGETLGIVGESGSGKSTLIKAAMGLLGPDGLVTRGDIRYMNQNILDIPEKEKRKIRGAGIGMIFQDAGASLCPIRTIGEQIYESMRVQLNTSIL